MSPIPHIATIAAATSGTSIGVKRFSAVRREAIGTVTADARFSTPANAIAAAAIRVEGPATEVGQLRPAGVTGNEARSAAGRQTDRDTTGQVVVAQSPRQPRDGAKRVVQLRDDERQRDRQEDELDREPRREQSENVKERIVLAAREDHDREEDRERGEHG